MTYVREQSPAELRAHMKWLQKMPGWREPLADRLYQEIQDLDRQIAALKSQHDGDERDAERYRTLRDVLYRKDIQVGEAHIILKAVGACPGPQEIDAAVDAALNSAAEGGKNG